MGGEGRRDEPPNYRNWVSGVPTRLTTRLKNLRVKAMPVDRNPIKLKGMNNAPISFVDDFSLL